MADGPKTDVRAQVIRGYHSYTTWLVTKGLDHAAHNTFLALAWAISDVRRRRTVKRFLAEAGEPAPIGSAPEGLVRIEGRVEIVEAVTTPGGMSVAAYEHHVEAEEVCGCQPGCVAVLRVVRSTRHTGRFLVADDTGAALVSGSIALADYRGNALDPYEPGELTVREGDSVTVLGPGRRGSAPNLRAWSTRGFRDAQPPLVFEATARDVLVFAPSSRARAAG